MKILYVTTISNTVNAFLIPHIKMLVDQGHQVDVAFNIKNSVKQEIIDMGCKVHTIEFERSPLNKGNYKAYKKIKKIIKDESYDLVHTHTPVASVIVRLACRRIKNTKVFYTAHGFHFFKGSPLRNWLIYYPIEKLAARWTDGLITMNEEDYEMSKKLKIRDNGFTYKVHGVGIDLEKFQPKNLEEKKKIREKYGYKEENFILFYAAELNYNKHQDLLIDAINILKDKIPNIKLLLAGIGNFNNKYKDKIEELGLTSNVELLGLRRDVPKLLLLSDVAVASSRREGLPVNVIEAMATGLPLVVTDIRGQRDLVRHGENGYLVGVDDIECFVDSIERLYKDSELRIRFGKKNVELSKKYSLDNVIQSMDEIYFNCLE